MQKARKHYVLQAFKFADIYFCGEGGIRTRDSVSTIHTFQACSFNHSDTSPTNSGLKIQAAKIRLPLLTV